jgi:hypothetical protein
VHATFTDVMWIVCGLGIMAALLALRGTGKAWEDYSKRGLFMESAQGNRPTPASVNSLEAERLDEIRQLVEAANNRRALRGETTVDVEAEVKRLTADAGPSASRQIDPELEDEVRALVELRNQRRIKRGDAPLDVAAEISRELDALAPLANAHTRLN